MLKEYTNHVINDSRVNSEMSRRPLKQRLKVNSNLIMVGHERSPMVRDVFAKRKGSMNSTEMSLNLGLLMPSIDTNPAHEISAEYNMSIE